MPTFSLTDLPEVFLSSKSISEAVSRAVAAGEIRKLASRLYTTNLSEPPEDLVRRHIWQIVGLYFPGGLIADRTAIENRPASDGSIFLVASKKRDIELPGHTLRPRQGSAPLRDDLPFVGGLRLSSPARAFLENMRPSRASKDRVSRTLTRRELEERLEEMLRRGGEVALNRLRDDVRRIAPELDMADEAEALDELIGTLLGSRQAHVVAPVAIARTKGTPFDPKRAELFNVLLAALRDTPPTPRPEPKRTTEGASTLAFFEAYFSNYIEGTEFEVSEAEEIVFQGKIPRQRPQDAHDILGTFRVVSSAKEMRRIPRTAEEFLKILCERHAEILNARPDKRPGQFKELANRAGLTQFVAPELVRGTLSTGFEFLSSLSDPFQRALFMMFLVSEVHPFDDGNGRMARIMMNAELVTQGEQRIVIPTSYRNNYLAALRVLSRTSKPSALLRTMDFAQRYTLRMEWGAVDRTRMLLDKTNAFLDSDEAENSGIRLLMPTAELLADQD